MKYLLFFMICALARAVTMTTPLKMIVSTTEPIYSNFTSIDCADILIVNFSSCYYEIHTTYTGADEMIGFLSIRHTQNISTYFYKEDDDEGINWFYYINDDEAEIDNLPQLNNLNRA